MSQEKTSSKDYGTEIETDNVFSSDPTRANAIDDTEVRDGSSSAEHNRLTPLESKKQDAFDQQIKKDKALELLWKVLVFAIPAFLTILGIIIAIYVGMFTYYLKEVSGPMEGMGTQIENIQRNIDDLKVDIREIRSFRPVGDVGG